MRQVTTRKGAYGILRTNRIGGTLLYGPPGTGKTLLARVLARESGAVTICVSAAEIESKWIGESEKAIKALFNLGQMLSPSIIFIDEADSMFGQRQQDSNYHRGRVNQFLTALDGLVKCETPPFVLIASNLPQQIDPAVLRRIPSRLYMRLPTVDGRQRLFRLFLRGEQISPGVNFDDLARFTKAFSGSDILALCVQAALICEANTTDSEDDKIRVLEMDHFTTAMKSCAPTVSRIVMSHIRSFAKQFDPVGWTKMQTDEINTTIDPKVKNGASPSVKLSQPETEGAEAQYHSTFLTFKADSNSTHGKQSPGSFPVTERFAYTALDPGKNQIRVLSFNSSRNAPHLQITLETVDLDEVAAKGQPLLQSSSIPSLGNTPDMWRATTENLPEQGSFLANEAGLHGLLSNIAKRKHRFKWGDYLALSYVWGNADHQEDIVLNGQKFQVTRNLFIALKYLRDTMEVSEYGIKIWADAISINQEDLHERASEVKRIGMIYGNAFCVRAWIGQSLPDVASALATTRQWLDKAALTDEAASPDHHVSEALRIFLLNISAQPYWKRLWIMQEIALASSLIISYGKWDFTPEEIMILLKAVRTVHDPAQPVESFEDFRLLRKGSLHLGKRLSSFFVKLTRLRRFPTGVVGFDAVDTIHLAQSAQATDPRDKVYGLLSLLPTDIVAQISPRYDPDFTAADAFIAFSRICLQQPRGLGRLARWANRYRPNENLPSWTFDLEAQSTMNDVSVESTHLFGVNITFNACGSLQTTPTFPDGEQILSCEGILIDTVQSVTADASWQTHEGDTDSQSSLSMALDMEQDLGPPTDLETYEEQLHCDSIPSDSRLALARVLCMNSNYNFDQGPSMLDIPWSFLTQLSTFNEPYTDEEDINLEQMRQLLRMEESPVSSTMDWLPVASRLLWRNFFSKALEPNASFVIHGVELQQYFSTDTQPDATILEALETQQIFYNPMHERRLFTTREGRIGLGPKAMSAGDDIAILGSCDMPVVLRKKGVHFEFIGGCFIDGIMDGEAVVEADAEGSSFHRGILSII